MKKYFLLLFIPFYSCESLHDKLDEANRQIFSKDSTTACLNDTLSDLKEWGLAMDSVMDVQNNAIINYTHVSDSIINEIHEKDEIIKQMSESLDIWKSLFWQYKSDLGELYGKYYHVTDSLQKIIDK